MENSFLAFIITQGFEKRSVSEFLAWVKLYWYHQFLFLEMTAPRKREKNSEIVLLPNSSFNFKNTKLIMLWNQRLKDTKITSWRPKSRIWNAFKDESVVKQVIFPAFQGNKFFFLFKTFKKRKKFGKAIKWEKEPDCLWC